MLTNVLLYFSRSRQDTLQTICNFCPSGAVSQNVKEKKKKKKAKCKTSAIMLPVFGTPQNVRQIPSTKCCYFEQLQLVNILHCKSKVFRFF